MMSTIQDVAKRAVVSVSTVSNVINGRVTRMRPETLQRVETAIRELHFRPSKLAQQLKTGNTPLLGLLVPSMTNPMYGYIAKEIENCAQKNFGYRLLIGSTYRDKEKEIAFFDDLLSQGVRRVIVISSLADERHFETAADNGMVIVSYDRGAIPGRISRVNHVMPDNFAAAHMATKHLIDKGHTNLAFVTVAGMTMSRSAKIDGFYAAAEDFRLRKTATVIDAGSLNEYGDSVIAEVGRATAVEIAKFKNRPTGIVALNDLMALGLMAGFRDAGLVVPSDISVVGIDGMYLGALANPSLTSIKLPVYEIANEMVNLAMSVDLDKSEHGVEKVFPPSCLLERESVSALTMPTVKSKIRI